MTIPNTGGGGAASGTTDVAIAVLAAATLMASQPVAALAALLAVTVLEAPTAPTVQANVAVLMAVAPPPPPPMPPEPPPPPMNVQCGCGEYRNGVSEQSSSFCVKVEGDKSICYVYNDGCPGDMTRCPVAIPSAIPAPNACMDSIKTKKCARKARKGKCRKRKIAQIKCRLTCATCRP
jgi:hypothetical protein